MGAAFFYHLTQRTLEDVLPPLVDKAVAAHGRVAIRAREATLLDRLDLALWRGEGFLPHGIAGGPHDARQPVLLTTATAAANGARCLMSVGGAEIGEDEARDLDRVCILFDGGDAGAVETARNQWRRLTGAGVAAQYWADEGGWVKKAESA